MRKALLTLALVIVAILPPAQQAATARQATPASDIFPQLKVSLSGTLGHGGASGALWLLPDTWLEMTLFAGKRGEPGTTLCESGVQVAAPGAITGVPTTEDPAVAWTVAARLVDYHGDTATMDLRWRREPRAKGLEPAMIREMQVRWNASEGGTTILDTVHGLDQGDGACASTAVTAEFGVGSASEFRTAAIAYDAWLIQRLPTGEVRTHHVRTSGQQGEAVSMMFPVVPLSVGQGAASLELLVHGQIRGRLRTDGSIEIVVDAARSITDGTMGISTSGRSRLRMGLGETVEFAPPPLVGDVRGRNLAALVSDAPTAIRIRATRLW